MSLEQSGEKYHRIQFDFSGEAFRELEELREITKASSWADLMRKALSVLVWAEGHISKGDKIVVERKRDGTLVEVEFMFPHK